MRSPILTEYLTRVSETHSSGTYVARRFSVAKDKRGTDEELGYQFRGVLRDTEPELSELLKHQRVIVVGEPGAGKSVVAHAAVRTLIEERERVPVYGELKQYRKATNLVGLLKVSAPAEAVEIGHLFEGKPIARTYVLDGVDEIPAEMLAAFGKDLDDLLGNDKDARIFLTSRQAFYAAHRESLPDISSVFHILDLSDEDIREFVENADIDCDAFLQAVIQVDANDEIRNPFVLQVMLERFGQQGKLGKLRSENLSFIIDRLIQSRPLIGQHKQRRALCMLAVAMETYCRNELSEDEALQIIKQSMPIAEAEAPILLKELYGSILRRTTNGFAFQMRSYGEYLAAEALESVTTDRLRELAFLDYSTPNESWMNCISYMAELNADVKKLFVKQYPLWMLSSSSQAFKDDEKEQVMTGVLSAVASEGQYIQGHPGINLQRLGRFLTPQIVEQLLEDLKIGNAVQRANALLLLSWGKTPTIEQEAMAALLDRQADEQLRRCALYALINTGDSKLIPELLAFASKDDPLYTNILDLIGAVCDETQIRLVLPLIVEADSLLSNSFYHFREFRSHDALLAVLRFFVGRPEELSWVRGEGYVAPIIKLLPKLWDGEVAATCAAVIVAIEEQKVFLSNAGVGLKLFSSVEEADKEGLTARLYLEWVAKQNGKVSAGFYFTDQLVASLMRPKTAEWLVESGASDLIKRIARFLPLPMRDILREHSDGLIAELEKNTQVYELERVSEQESRKAQNASWRDDLLNAKEFEQSVVAFQRLGQDHWPDLPAEYKTWLGGRVSELLEKMDLENVLVWKNQTVTYPRILPLLLKLVEKYELKLSPDKPLVFTITTWHEKLVADYFRKHELSDEAKLAVETLLTQPKSAEGLRGTIGFLRDSGLWSESIRKGLEDVVRDPVETNSQIDALSILGQHAVETDFLVEISAKGASEGLREAAFEILVERQHRPTIERALSQLVKDDETLKSGERYPPLDLPLGWIGKIRSEFAIDKLIALRAKLLSLALPGEVGLVTETLARIDRAKLAATVRRQIPLAPDEWKHAQLSIAIEQERLGRVESVHSSPFAVILRRLKGSTNLRRLKVVCEGQTDVSVFRELLSQVPDLPELAFDFVGGWPNLGAKDASYFQQGCHEAFVVMDGDLGRKLNKNKKPLTDIARTQKKRLAGLGVPLEVLERYGIENYFPQKALEAVTGKNLSAYFPIPDHIAVNEYLREPTVRWKDRVKRFLVFRLRLSLSFSGPSLYDKKKNQDVARQVSLDGDLKGSDLFTIIHAIAAKANALAD
jgi:hypothetical protein